MKPPTVGLKQCQQRASHSNSDIYKNLFLIDWKNWLCAERSNDWLQLIVQLIVEQWTCKCIRHSIHGNLLHTPVIKQQWGWNDVRQLWYSSQSIIKNFQGRHFVTGQNNQGSRWVLSVWILAAMTRASPLWGFETMLDKCDQPPLLQIWLLLFPNHQFGLTPNNWLSLN